MKFRTSIEDPHSGSFIIIDSTIIKYPWLLIKFDFPLLHPVEFSLLFVSSTSFLEFVHFSRHWIQIDGFEFDETYISSSSSSSKTICLADNTNWTDLIVRMKFYFYRSTIFIRILHQYWFRCVPHYKCGTHCRFLENSTTNSPISAWWAWRYKLWMFSINRAWFDTLRWVYSWNTHTQHQQQKATCYKFVYVTAG